jgi:hypothetical protein
MHYTAGCNFVHGATIAHTAKIVARILRRRFERRLEDSLGDQFGFRRG